MKLVIDLQACQTRDSRNRGVGRYSLALADSMVRSARGHDVVVAINRAFPDTIEPIRRHFSDLIPAENLRVWGGIQNLEEIHPSRVGHRLAAESVKNSFFNSLSADFVHTTSLFEGLGDAALTTVDRHFNGMNAVTLYDLIPYIRKDTYLTNPRINDWYRRRIVQLRQADLALAISESSRREGIDELALSERSVVNISCAADDQFRKLDVDPRTELEVRTRYGITRNFLMYTGGIDFRKNIEGLISAYALLPHRIRQDHQLVIVCHAGEDDKKRLNQVAASGGLKSDEILLTGFVSDADLVVLYNICKLFIFPSLHEGFGLPALEAMSCGAAVIGSNCTSIPEVIGRQDALFDPTSRETMTAKLAEALQDESFLESLRESGYTRAKQFSWENSANLAWDAFEESLSRRLHKKDSAQINASPRSTQQRPRLAYVSPLPPEQSGISLYSATLLPYLAAHYEIDVVNDGVITDPWVSNNLKQVSCSEFEAMANSYDRVLYQMGNSQFHAQMPYLLANIPGTVVLHDFFLSGLFRWLQENGQPRDAWEAALEHSHGAACLLEHLNGSPLLDSIIRYPCNLAILENANGVITHSRYSKGLAQKYYDFSTSERWEVIPHLRTRVDTLLSKAEARQRLGIAPNTFVVCSFGGISSIFKLSNTIAEAWSKTDLATSDDCMLVFAGASWDPIFDEQVNAYVSSGRVTNCTVTGYLEDADYQLWLSACDVSVQLRAQSRGETSGAIQEAMAAGKQVIVNAHGTVIELPDDVVSKLPDRCTPEEVAKAITDSRIDPASRERVGQRAAEYVESNQDPKLIARQYAHAIETFANRPGQQRIREALSHLRSLGPLGLNTREWQNLRRHLDDIATSTDPVSRTFIDVSSLLDGAAPSTAVAQSSIGLRMILGLLPLNRRLFFVRKSRDGNYQYANDLLGFPKAIDTSNFGSDQFVTLLPEETPILWENFVSLQ